MVIDGDLAVRARAARYLISVLAYSFLAGEFGDATGPDRPPTLLHAVDALIADPVVAGALDAAGPGVSDYSAARQRDEFLDWHAAVSPAEVDRYLTAF